MHSSIITAALVLASGVFAAPHRRNNGTVTTSSFSNTNAGVRVSLQNQAIELGRQFQFGGLANERKSVGGDVYETISVRVDPANPNQALRCKALDAAGAEIIATRGANTDITFADGGNALEWTFIEPTAVSTVICDPAFVKAPAEDFEIRVALSASSLGTQTVLSFASGLESPPLGTSGPYETVELRLGQSLPQDLRCQISDANGEPLVVLRNGNRDTTFADGNAGEWRLEQESEVANIVCDLDFVKASA